MSRHRSAVTFRHVLTVTVAAWVRGAVACGRVRAGAVSLAVCVVAGVAEETGERSDGFEQQGVDAGLLVGGAVGAEFGDGAAGPQQRLP